MITSDKDREFQSRIEALLGRTVHVDNLVHTEGIIKAYDIRALIRGHGKEVY